MPAAEDTPKVIHLPSRGNVALAIRNAYASGRPVQVVTKTARLKDLRRCLKDLGDWRGAHWACADTGDGWTLTVFAHTTTPAPFAYMPKCSDESRWVWACRACGAVDEGWSWPEDEGGETAPMVRYSVDRASLALVPVPWECPRRGCHGRPKWQRAA